MINNRIRSHLPLFAGLVLFLSGAVFSGTAVAQSEFKVRNPVVVRLNKSRVCLFSTTVRIGHVATVLCDDAALAQRVRDLDLDVLKEPNQSVQVTPNQVRYRMLLAGISDEQITLAGLDAAQVELQWLDDVLVMLTSTFSEQLAAHYGIPATQFKLALGPDARGVIEQHPFDWQTAWVKATFPDELRDGASLLNVDVQNDNTLVNIQLPVRVLLLPKVDARRGRQLVAGVSDDVMLRAKSGEPAIAADPQVQPVAYEMASDHGKAVLRPAATVTSISAGNSGLLIKPNAVVKVVQRIGNVEIVLKTARAATGGKLGETVELISPFRNQLGKEIRLMGRVLSESEVELVR